MHKFELKWNKKTASPVTEPAVFIIMQKQLLSGAPEELSHLIEATSPGQELMSSTL